MVVRYIHKQCVHTDLKRTGEWVRGGIEREGKRRGSRRKERRRRYLKTA